MLRGLKIADDKTTAVFFCVQWQISAGNYLKSRAQAYAQVSNAEFEKTYRNWEREYGQISDYYTGPQKKKVEWTLQVSILPLWILSRWIRTWS